jgi:hypothetical protein
MKNKITLADKIKDGWSVAVSADVTCKFLEFCRKNDMDFSVDVGVVSGGGVVDTDYFYFSNATQKELKNLIKKFIG